MIGHCRLEGKWVADDYDGGRKVVSVQDFSRDKGGKVQVGSRIGYTKFQLVVGTA